MKSEQTECNKEIALMLGWKETSAHKRDRYGYYQCVEGYSTPYRNTLDTQAVEYQYDKNAFAVEDLQFHSDWNWIMDVIFKINILPNSKDQSDTTLQTHRVNVQSTLRSANMEAVVLSINKFLIWYNEAKK